MTSYRKLDDPQQILPIARAAFAFRGPEKASVGEWLATAIGHNRELFGVYQDTSLQSAFMLYEFDMRLRESVVSMGGIGLLCSRMDARGKGAVRSMLTHALQTMKDRGHVVSVLDPFDESFYRNYGWEKFSRRLIIELVPSTFRIPEQTDSDIVAADMAFPDDAARAFYNRYASTHHTLAQRGQGEWESRMKVYAWSEDVAARGVVRFSQGEQVVGLMEYELSRKASEYRSTFTVNLLAHEQAATLHEMLRYLKRLSHQISTIRLNLPLDTDLWPYFSDRPQKCTVSDEFMIRIVSMEALDGLLISVPDMSMTVEVSDGQAPWNPGMWALTVNDGVLQVTRGEHADVRCGIGALSSVISGFSTFQEMISAGYAEPLDTYRGQDFQKTIPFLADHF